MLTPLLLVAAGLLLAVATLVGSYFARRRHQERDPLGAALDSVASKLHLTSTEEALVQRLADEAGVAPVALLLSGSLLDRATTSLDAADAMLAVSIRRKAGAAA